MEVRLFGLSAASRRRGTTGIHCRPRSPAGVFVGDGQPIDWKSFRELDEAWGARKGTAFLAFKRALPSLREGTDFIYLNHHQQQDEIAQLRAADRIYVSSVNVVLITAATARKLCD